MRGALGYLKAGRWLPVVLLLWSCSFSAGVPENAAARPTAVAGAARAIAETPPPATRIANPTVAMQPSATLALTAPTARPMQPATPAPDPVAGLTIPDLRAISYGAGEISIGEVWIQASTYTTYRMSYPAGGLRLTGLLHVPAGDGPFPVLVANRGTIARERYQPGMDSRTFADYMARRGYLVVAPDFRGYAGGDDGPNPFYTGYYQDVLHLIPLAQQLPMAKPGKIGMWGHSRGASVTVAALTISDQIAAAVVYAPAPADLAADYARRMRQSGGSPGAGTWPFTPADDPAAYARVSPINYFDAVSAPVMLHHGTTDTTVDYSASAAIADALRTAGKDVTLHLYDGGGHTLQGEQERVYLRRTLEFFQKYLG